MFLLNRFPDPRRLRPLPGNEAYRQRFYARWGKEHCIVLAGSRLIEFPPYRQRLSVKTVIRGVEHYDIDGRTVLLDELNYLIVNDGRTYASWIDSDRAVETFSIFFAPGFAEDIVHAVLDDSGDPLAEGAQSGRREFAFSEHLRLHDRLVTPVLRRIRDQARMGMNADAWHEEQFVALLEAMVRSQRRTNTDIHRLPFARPATRREVFRRIALATDYLHSNLRSDLQLEELARVAHISKYHFIRLFETVHGLTPHAYLQRVRATIAARLLATTRLPQMEVLSRAGFTSRSTMFRELRRLMGLSGRRIRADARQEPPVAASDGWADGQCGRFGSRHSRA